MTDLVLTPSDALHYIEQELFDAAVPDAVLAISVHQVGDKIACNTWIRQHSRWEKLIPERITTGDESDATPEFLIGEVFRTLQEYNSFQHDLRMKIGIIGLLSEAQKKIK